MHAKIRHLVSVLANCSNSRFFEQHTEESYIKSLKMRGDDAPIVANLESFRYHAYLSLLKVYRFFPFVSLHFLLMFRCTRGATQK